MNIRALVFGIIIVGVVGGGWWYMQTSNVSPSESSSTLQEITDTKKEPVVAPATKQSAVKQPAPTAGKSATASPTSGKAPLTVEFTYYFPSEWQIHKTSTGEVSPTAVTIDFGDNPERYWKLLEPKEIVDMTVQHTSHTYTTPGTYVATFMLDCGKDYCANTTISTITVQ